VKSPVEPSSQDQGPAEPLAGEPEPDLSNGSEAARGFLRDVQGFQAPRSQLLKAGDDEPARGVAFGLEPVLRPAAAAAPRLAESRHLINVSPDASSTPAGRKNSALTAAINEVACRGRAAPYFAKDSRASTFRRNFAL
jgi:hypothetical protein